MSRRAPNRFSADKTHASYGIKNWLNSQNITNQALIRLLRREFVTKEGFTTASDPESTRATSFIQGRFSAFCVFVIKRVKELATEGHVLQQSKPAKKKTPVEGDSKWEAHLKRTAWEQKQINGSGPVSDFTGAKLSVRGPGIGVEGVRRMRKAKLSGADKLDTNALLKELDNLIQDGHRRQNL